jgi:positive phototaxis protein PixI
VVSEFLSASDSLSTRKLDRRSQQQFLRFHLEPDTAAMLPVAQLSEVLTIGLGQIVPIPHLPPWVLGVYNWRGEILWMVDLGYLVGLTPWHQQSVARSHYRAIILNGDISFEQNQRKRSFTNQDRNQMLGLVVSRVEDIEWCDTDDLHSPPTASISAKLISYLRGIWVKPNHDVVLALDGQSIIAKLKNQ